MFDNLYYQFTKFYNMGRITNKKKFKSAKSLINHAYNLELEDEIDNVTDSQTQSSRSSDVLPVIKQVYIISSFLLLTTKTISSRKNFFKYFLISNFNSCLQLILPNAHGQQVVHPI